MPKKPNINRVQREATREKVQYERSVRHKKVQHEKGTTEKMCNVKRVQHEPSNMEKV